MRRLAQESFLRQSFLLLIIFIDNVFLSNSQEKFIYLKSCTPYLVNFLGAVLRQQMSGLQTISLHGFANLKMTGISRFFRAFFLRFLLLISWRGGSTIVCTNEGKGSSAIVFSCSTSCAIFVLGISSFSVFFGYFSRSSLISFLGDIFISSSVASSIGRCESFSIFRLANFFMKRFSFEGTISKSSISSYFCFSCL